MAGRESEETTEKLLLRAEIFRSKLIENFLLLDTLTDKSEEAVPKYYSTELSSGNKVQTAVQVQKPRPNLLCLGPHYSNSQSVNHSLSSRRLVHILAILTSNTFSSFFVRYFRCLEYI